VTDAPASPAPPATFTNIGGEIALNFDSVTTYVTERGVVRKGAMFPLEHYNDPDPLVPPTQADKAIDFIRDAKSVAETTTKGFNAIKTTIGNAKEFL